jgi:ABC-type branched-subunit amino acid transport system substrate-binding protein
LHLATSRVGTVATQQFLLYDIIMMLRVFVFIATLLGCAGFTTAHPAQIVRIGGMYPLTDITTGLMNSLGSQWLAGSLMAVRDLNVEYATKNVKFELAVRDSRRTFSNTVEGSLELSRKVFKNSGTHIIVGAGTRRYIM